MKLRKSLAVALAVALLSGMATPAFATGYVTPPTTPNYSYDDYMIETDDDGGTGFVPGTTAGGATAGGGATTTIGNNQTPTTNAPGNSGNSAGLKNNNGAKPLNASDIVAGKSSYVNVTIVPVSELKKLTSTVHFDVRVGGVTIARLYIDPKTSDNLPDDLDVSMSVDPADTQKTNNRFNKYFGGNNAVVSMAHKGSFGTSVQMAIHTNQLKGVDLTKLKAVVYNKATNSYVKVDPANLKIEGNYVYINITSGGELVFSDSSKL